MWAQRGEACEPNSVSSSLGKKIVTSWICCGQNHVLAIDMEEGFHKSEQTLSLIREFKI